MKATASSDKPDNDNAWDVRGSWEI
jgi:hypothetical protein